MQPCTVNRGYLAGNGRETEAINQQMMVTLIPIPTLVSHLNEQVKNQRFATISTYVLLQVCLHQRSCRLMGIGFFTQVNNVGLRKGERGVYPLPDLAVIFAKPHP